MQALKYYRMSWLGSALWVASFSEMLFCHNSKTTKGLPITHLKALHLLKGVSICPSQLGPHWLECWNWVMGMDVGTPEQNTGGRGKKGLGGVRAESLSP